MCNFVNKRKRNSYTFLGHESGRLVQGLKFIGFLPLFRSFGRRMVAGGTGYGVEYGKT
jgi:hypothetical protein